MATFIIYLFYLLHDKLKADEMIIYHMVLVSVLVILVQSEGNI